MYFYRFPYTQIKMHDGPVISLRPSFSLIPVLVRHSILSDQIWRNGSLLLQHTAVLVLPRSIPCPRLDKSLFSLLQTRRFDSCLRLLFFCPPNPLLLRVVRRNACCTLSFDVRRHLFIYLFSSLFQPITSQFPFEFSSTIFELFSVPLTNTSAINFILHYEGILCPLYLFPSR